MLNSYLSRIGKSGLVVLMASTLFMIGCADNRGFKVKRLDAPNIETNEKDKAPDSSQTTPEESKDTSLEVFKSGELGTGEQTESAEEGSQEDSNTDLREDSVSDVAPPSLGNPAVYVEEMTAGAQLSLGAEAGGEGVITEKVVSKEEKAELTRVLEYTESLNSSQLFVKGLRANIIDSSGGESFKIEVGAVIELDGRQEVLTSEVILVKSADSTDGLFGGRVESGVFVSGRTDIRVSLMSQCQDSEIKGVVTACGELRVLLALFPEGKEPQAVRVAFERNGNSYVLGGGFNVLPFDQALATAGSEADTTSGAQEATAGEEQAAETPETQPADAPQAEIQAAGKDVVGSHIEKNSVPKSGPKSEPKKDVVGNHVDRNSIPAAPKKDVVGSHIERNSAPKATGNGLSPQTFKRGSVRPGSTNDKVKSPSTQNPASQAVAEANKKVTTFKRGSVKPKTASATVVQGGTQQNPASKAVAEANKKPTSSQKKSDSTEKKPSNAFNHR